MKDYTEGRGYLDEGRLIFLDAPRKSWADVAWHYFCMACLGALIGCVLATLQGCASNGPQICVVQLMGSTPEGLAVVRQFCESQEEFEESQK